MKSTIRSRGLDEAARELKGIIAENGFIRRDRGNNALFVSDFPVRSPGITAALLERLARAGWDAQVMGGLCRLDFTPARYRAFLETLPAGAPGPGLAHVLFPHARKTLEAELPLLRRALKLWDAGDAQTLLKEAGRALGEGLRNKTGVPGFYLTLVASGEGVIC